MFRLRGHLPCLLTYIPVPPVRTVRGTFPPPVFTPSNLNPKTSSTAKPHLSIPIPICHHHELHRPARGPLWTPLRRTRIATSKTFRSPHFHQWYANSFLSHILSRATANQSLLQQVHQPQSLDSSPPPATPASS